MSFSNMLEILQEKNKNLVVLIRLGVFYIATGKDAVFLNKELGLKCICYKNQVCKIGIPENRIEYYLRKLEKINIGYIVYYFDSKSENLIERYKYIGKYHKETKDNRNCLICKGIRYYENDKYMNAVQKLFKNESLKDENS